MIYYIRLWNYIQNIKYLFFAVWDLGTPILPKRENAGFAFTKLSNIWVLLHKSLGKTLVNRMLLTYDKIFDTASDMKSDMTSDMPVKCPCVCVSFIWDVYKEVQVVYLYIHLYI